MTPRKMITYCIALVAVCSLLWTLSAVLGQVREAKEGHHAVNKLNRESIARNLGWSIGPAPVHDPYHAVRGLIASSSENGPTVHSDVALFTPNAMTREARLAAAERAAALAPIRRSDVAPAITVVAVETDDD